MASIRWVGDGLSNVAWGSVELEGAFLRFEYERGGGSQQEREDAVLYRVVECGGGRRELLSLDELERALKGDSVRGCELTSEARVELVRVLSRQ